MARSVAEARGAGNYALRGAHPVTEVPPNILSARCPSRATLELIANRWTVLVIAAITRGHTRNGALLREIGGISQKVLTDVLRRLEARGIVAREVVSHRPLHVEYRLTDVGASLVPLISAMGRWAETPLDVGRDDAPVTPGR